MGWIESYLNEPEVKAALGVNPQLNFESCNMAINQAFMLKGDSMHNTPLLLKEIINDGVRLLVYAGNAGEVSYSTFMERIAECIFRYDVQLHGRPPFVLFVVIQQYTLGQRTLGRTTRYCLP